jgi:hypothetical protein
MLRQLGDQSTASWNGKALEYVTGLDEFFAGQGESREMFEAVRRAVEAIGAAQLRIGKSQVSFRRRKAFAWIWMPGQYLRGKTAPLVVLSFPIRDPSPRWKETAEPTPGRFTHHLEPYSVADIDDEVRGSLREAWAAAG